MILLVAVCVTLVCAILYKPVLTRYYFMCYIQSAKEAFAKPTKETNATYMYYTNKMISFRSNAIPVILNGLESDNAAIKMESARLLCGMDPDPRALKPLIKMGNNKGLLDVSRKQAIWALSKYKQKEAFNALVDILSKKDEGSLIIGCAIWSLAEREENVIPTILADSLDKHAEKDVYKTYLQAFMKRPNTVSTETLCKALIYYCRTASSVHYPEDELFVSTLKKVRTASNPTASDIFVSFIKKNSASSEISSVCIPILKILNDPQTIDVLIGLLDDENHSKWVYPALRDLTNRRRFPNNKEAWFRWWEKIDKSSFKKLNSKLKITFSRHSITING